MSDKRTVSHYWTNPKGTIGSEDVLLSESDGVVWVAQLHLTWGCRRSPRQSQKFGTIQVFCPHHLQQARLFL